MSKNKHFGLLSSLESFGVNNITDTFDQNPQSTFVTTDTQKVPGLPSQSAAHVPAGGATASFENDGTTGNPVVEDPATVAPGATDPLATPGVDPEVTGEPGAGTEAPIDNGSALIPGDAAAAGAVLPQGPTEEDVVEELTETDDVGNLDQDVQEVTDYVEVATENLENSIDALGRLEEVTHIAEASTDDAGLDRTGAAMLTHAVESFFAAVPGSSDGRGIVSSLESFGGTGSRHFSTQASVENVQSTMKAWAEKAKKAVEQIIQRIIQMVQFILSRFGQIEKRLDKQIAALDALKSDNVITVSNKSVAGRLNVNGKVGSNFATYLNVVLTTMQTINTSVSARPAVVRGLFEELTKKPEEWNSARQKMLEQIAVTARIPGGKVEKKDGKTVYFSADLPGGKVLSQTIGDESKGLMDNLRSYSVTMQDKPGLNVDPKVTTMSINEAKAVAKLAKEIVAEAGKLREAGKAAQAARSEMTKVLFKDMNFGEGDRTGLSTQLRALTTISVRMMSEPASTFAKYALTLMRDVTLYIDMTLRTNKSPAVKDSKNALDQTNMPKALAAPAKAA